MQHYLRSAAQSFSTRRGVVCEANGRCANTVDSVDRSRGQSEAMNVKCFTQGDMITTSSKQARISKHSTAVARLRATLPSPGDHDAGGALKTWTGDATRRSFLSCV